MTIKFEIPDFQIGYVPVRYQLVSVYEKTTISVSMKKRPEWKTTKNEKRPNRSVSVYEKTTILKNDHIFNDLSVPRMKNGPIFNDLSGIGQYRSMYQKSVIFFILKNESMKKQPNRSGIGSYEVPSEVPSERPRSNFSGF